MVEGLDAVAVETTLAVDLGAEAADVSNPDCCTVTGSWVPG